MGSLKSPYYMYSKAGALMGPGQAPPEARGIRGPGKPRQSRGSQGARTSPARGPGSQGAPKSPTTFVRWRMAVHNGVRLNIFRGPPKLRTTDILVINAYS
ncbi:hypothetical protein J6590_074950 [Homalodisca vitripennis]|nr:hypothetical protein J6590_074950 [Homalodisca vitripennis]